MFKWLVVITISTILLTNTSLAWASNINVPNGYKIEKIFDNLTYPTIDFDDQGRMLIAESSKIIRLEKDGSKHILAEGDKAVFYDKKIYIVRGGTISIIQNDGSVKDIITDLPAGGDYGVSKPVFRDGKIYFGVGTVTNSGVVGSDNAWIQDPAKRWLRDIPCKDITITENSVFESNTSAYSSFGQITPTSWLVPGDIKCNGAILRANPDGTELEVYAWGFRNPYELEFSTDGALFVTNRGFDARGSRPIENAWDCLYRVEKDAWYGWPDFACDIPVTDGRFKPAGKPQPEFIMNNHPTETPPSPLIKFPSYTDISGMAFALNREWGESDDLFVSMRGKIVKVNIKSQNVEDFIVTEGTVWYPTSLRFSEDNSLYITSIDGIWKITRVKGFTVTPKQEVPLDTLKKILLGSLLIGVAYWVIWSRSSNKKTKK